MCLNIEVGKQKQRIIIKKKNIEKKNTIFFFLSPPKKLPEVAGVRRPVVVNGSLVAVAGGWRWLEVAAGPKPLHLKLVLRTL
jgi:hypothetical protein